MVLFHWLLLKKDTIFVFNLQSYGHSNIKNMNRAFKWMQQHYDSVMKWLRKFILNLEWPIIVAAPVNVTNNCVPSFYSNIQFNKRLQIRLLTPPLCSDNIIKDWNKMIGVNPKITKKDNHSSYEFFCLG